MPGKAATGAAVATVLVIALIALASLPEIMQGPGFHSTSSSSIVSSTTSTSFSSSMSSINSTSTLTISSKNSTSSATTVPVGSFLYLWYGNSTSGNGGLGSPGWNSSSSPGGGSVVDRPLSGYYVSDSNSTFSTQVSEMQGAGLSFAIVSWWGYSSNGENAAINKAVLDLFRYLKENDSKFQIAIMVDSYLPPNQPSSVFEGIYNYIYDQFVSPFPQWYFNFNGKPLILFFNPLYPTFDNSTFTVRTIGNRPNPVNWSFWDAPQQYFDSQYGPHVNASNDEGSPVISADGEVTIIPRADLYYLYLFGYFDSYLRFDYTLGQGLYASQWNYVIANKAHVKLVLIYSWNEYHERSEIEPQYETASNLSPYFLFNITEYYTRLLG
ncbi:MAG TPA: hypothetical protein VJN71_01490 [Nitrososphaerales archaeon]|nr:hypothetical protein [Nitrososphaerales archaeon]